MLDFDGDHPWKIGPRPHFVKIVGLLLLDAVVTIQLKPSAVRTRNRRIGWSCTPARKIIGEVSVKNGQGIAGFGMFVKTFGQQDVCPQVNVASPKLGQTFTFELDVFDVFGISGLGDGWNFLIEGQYNGFAGFGVVLDFEGFGIEITWCLVPLAPFTPIPTEFDHFSISPMVGLVFVEQYLDVIFASRNIF